VAANEALLAARWPETGGRLRRRDGGWSAVLDLPPGFTDEAVTTALLAWDGVLVHPGYYYDFAEENVLLLSLLTPEGDFRSGLEALLTRVRS
jgi:DNA-binding transcriptional MocR family regulator